MAIHIFYFNFIKLLTHTSNVDMHKHELVCVTLRHIQIILSNTMLVHQEISELIEKCEKAQEISELMAWDVFTMPETKGFDIFLVLFFLLLFKNL